MALHKDLTGAELHEPKGADTAAAGTVYVANGAGSGNWQPRDSNLYNANEFYLSARMLDISTAGNRVYFPVPTKSELVAITCILDGAIITANSVLSIYVNGVLLPDTLTVNYASSAAGTISSVLIATANTLDKGVVIEVRSNGASDNAVAAFIQLTLRAKA